MADEMKALDPREYAPWTVKETYHQIFFVPREPWRVWTNWAEGFFESAKLIVQGVVEGRLMEGVEGTTGVDVAGKIIEFLENHARPNKTRDRVRG